MGKTTLGDDKIIVVDTTSNQSISTTTSELSSQGGEAVSSLTLQQAPIMYPINNPWVDLVGHTAWPIIVLAAIIMFRKSIIGLIDEIEEGGFGSVGLKRGKSGKTKAPPSSGPQEKSSIVDSQKIKKLLATLWKYQQKHHGRTFTESRWTFLISPASPNYPEYLSALSEAVNKGLVVVSPQSIQCFLTNSGLKYCIENETELSDLGDFWEESQHYTKK